jgi:predicted amidohydrolase
MPDLRLLIAQLAPQKGEYAENLRRVGGVLAQAAGLDEPPGLIVFPETALTGYFLEGGVRELAATAGTVFRDLSAQHALSGAPPMDVVLGFYEEYQNRYYNSALYATLGGAEPGIRHVHRKVFLPTYGLFDEERFVDHGHSVRAFDTSWGRAALAICEDAWHSIVPTLAALDGAQLLIVPSASPARGIEPDRGRGQDDARPSSVRRWEILARQMANEHGFYVAFAQLGGFEGGKGLQGSSIVVDPQGDVVVRAPLFEEALLSATSCGAQKEVRHRSSTRPRTGLPARPSPPSRPIIRFSRLLRAPTRWRSIRRSPSGGSRPSSRTSSFGGVGSRRESWGFRAEWTAR